MSAPGSRATARDEARAEVAALLSRGGLPERLATAAVTLLGERAAGRIVEDPWLVLDLPGVRPDAADRFALEVADPRPERDDGRRGRAFVVHALSRAARDGHTVVAESVVDRAVAGLGFPQPRAAIEAAIEDDRVLGFEPELLALARYAMAEDSVADGLPRLAATAEPLSDPDEAEAAAAGLDDAQRAAVAAAAAHGVSLLTGGPGTGKSRTVAALVKLAHEHDHRLALAAPTGRAAKRLEELTGEPAGTLHRLLGAQGRTGNFVRGESWPLDADVVVVDETSMLDVELAAALLDACADGTHLVLVGDPAQLPSIGPGRVLGDIVDSAVTPVTELTTLHRQAIGGAIARLASSVRTGELPAIDPPGPQPEVVVVPAGGAEAAARRTVQLVTDSIPRALGIPTEDIQVCTPVHRGPAGTVALNQALKSILNEGPGARGGFDPGDRVVATANHLDLGFANGEVGVVVALSDGGGLEVVFGTGLVEVPAAVLGDLAHGWAITVHRAQGSEWPAVVAVLPAEAGGLLSRPLVYTAFTRAERHLSIVHACGPALAHAVRAVGARPRRTRLAALLRESSPRPV
ncbi:MAG TPA: AAA family ATPase [Mycobacteriales bacterium]|nr:AAA family ATPase [Mycobacteriales bacterium]